MIVPSESHIPLWWSYERARALVVCVTPAHTCSRMGVRCGRGDVETPDVVEDPPILGA